MKWKLAGLILALVLTGMTSVVRSVSGDVFGVPNSDQVFDLEIYFPDGEYPQPVQVTVRDGTMLTVINEQTGRTDTWAAYVTPDGKSMLKHFEVHTDLKGDHLNQLEPAVAIAQGGAYDFSAGWAFHIVNKGIYLGSFPDLRPIDPHGVPPKILAKIYGKTGGGICCVTCGGLTVCANSVDMDCGYCNYPGSGGRAV